MRWTIFVGAFMLSWRRKFIELWRFNVNYIKLYRKCYETTVSRSQLMALLLLYKLDKRCRWRTGFRFDVFRVKAVTSGEKVSSPKTKRDIITYEVNKASERATAVFVNYNYRIRSSPSAGELGMKYKVTHLSSLSGDWVKTLCQRLIAFYLQRNVFYLP